MVGRSAFGDSQGGVAANQTVRGQLVGVYYYCFWEDKIIYRATYVPDTICALGHLLTSSLDVRIH
jgi:hypothetical protein